MQYIIPETPTFESFYHCHVNLVRKVLAHRYPNYHEYLDDLTQETFVSAWKAYDRLDHVHVSAWVCQIAINVARHFTRHMQACHRLDCPLETTNGITREFPDLSQSETVACVEMSDSIAAAYQCLCPADQRMITLLLQEYTPKEIAVELHLDLNTYSWQIKRARQRFQMFYEQAKGE